MSLSSAEEFIEKLKIDQAFLQSLKEAKPVDRAIIITEAGFDFTNEELQQVIEQVSDEELSQVMGGQWKSEGNEMRIPEKRNDAGEMRYPWYPYN